MTVYELIQELSQYNADTEVKFNFKGDFEADVKATFDRDSEDDEQEVTAKIEFDDNLDYEDRSESTNNSGYAPVQQPQPSPTPVSSANDFMTIPDDMSELPFN